MRTALLFRLGATMLSIAAGLAPVRAASPATAPSILPPDPQVIQADEAIHVTFGESQRIVPKGLQPSMICTKSGTLVVQAQVPRKLPPSKRITYISAMDTVISRDGGETWTPLPVKPEQESWDLEGGIVQLRDGTILGLDTFITPGSADGKGMGQLYTTADDWRTLDGPIDMQFDLPGTDFYTSTDDGGRPHAAMRLHRRIIELPNGELVTTFYGWMKGDNTPCPYMPTMKKTRVMAAASADRGRHWKLLGTIAADPAVGTEGFDEPVICRVSKGPSAGRIICLMRTGRELFESTSDDDGRTWSTPRPRVFADLDVYRTDLWIDQLRNFKDFKGKPLDENNPNELRGAVVDPDMIELRSGLLVAAFGVRVPQKLCWQHPEFPWNGNYLAFSRDHGQTWSHVIRLTSGILTTHYMAIEETPTNNRVYIAYDLGGWSKGMARDVYGRTMTVSMGSR